MEENMSNIITEQFPFEQTADNKWLVHLERRDVTVETQEDAKLIAALSVELGRFYSDSLTVPDIEKSRKIVAVCKQHNLYRTVAAVRQLESRIEQWRPLRA